MRPILSCLLMGACAPADAVPPAAVRDSAGIRIVENRAPLAEPLDWSVAEQPTVAIGRWQADGAGQLNRPSSAIRLSGGQIVIADAGDAALRFFDAHGTPLRTVGRAGAGPGEFRYLWWIGRRTGDSIVAYDATLFRFSVFDSAGRLLGTHNLPARAGLVWRQATGLFPNGDVLVYGLTSGWVPRAEGVRRYERPLFRWRPGAAGFDSLGVTWMEEAYAAPMGRAFLEIPLPFGRNVDLVPWRDGLLFGWTDRWALHATDRAGRVTASYRIHRPAQPVSDGDREAALEFLRNRSSRDQIRRTVARAASSLPIPATMPAFGRWAWERVPSDDPMRPSLLVDADGFIWVIQFRPPGASRRWDILRADGRWLGTIGLPEGLEPLEIGPDWVLGWRKDALGVVSFALHELRRRYMSSSR